jgi:hypothetical protein
MLSPAFAGTLAHVPEKWIPVFREGHAQMQESGMLRRKAIHHPAVAGL